MMFVGENLTYTTVTASQGTAGTVWVSSFGAVEKHEINMGTGSTVPLFINNGCFLGMLDNDGVINFWKDYVSVGTANGFLSAMFTQLGWMMKIQDTNPPRRAGPVKVTVLTQTLNPQNLEKYIANIAKKTVEKMRSSGPSFLTSGIGMTANPSVLGVAAAAAALPMIEQKPVLNPINTGKPNMNPTQPTVNTVQPNMNPTQSTMNMEEPTMNPTQSTMNMEEPTMNPTEPSMNMVQPTLNTLQPTLNMSQRTDKSGGSTRRVQRRRRRRHRTIRR
jgi:hypothetical protein